MPSMKAITLHQPWASLCVEPRPHPDPCFCHQTSAGAAAKDLCQVRCNAPWKTIETRSWKAPASVIGQRIAIHAGMKRPVNLYHADMVTGPADGSWAMWRGGAKMMDLPLGAVVGTAVLEACVPMVGAGDVINAQSPPPRPPYIVDTASLGGCLCLVTAANFPAGESIEDQRPFGHFERGRWGWILGDVERFDAPVPARGFQGLWTWSHDG